MKVFYEINRLLDYAKQNLCLQSEDVNCVRNNILDILNIDCFEQTEASWNGCGIDTLLNDFVSAGVSDGIFTQQNAAYYCDKIMGALSLAPSALNGKFDQIALSDGTKAAMDFLYDYCVANNYVKKAVLDKNPRFCCYGLIVTINLAKPEFRDANKAKKENAVQGGYPQCVICRENEGLSKRGKSTLRTVSLKLGNEDWFWQFSPYGYFNQHGIAVNTKHIPMHIDKQTFVNLIEFADRFPHYFIGCNAPLERIGGSVLAHDHYQGGGEKLPLHSAGIKKVFKDKQYPDVIISIVDWEGSVVRINGYDKNSVAEVSEKIRRAWKEYTDKSIGIICKDGNTQFNEISPTVYKRCDGYEMNIILRSNITSDKYPDGVYHAHPEYHSIKKESIGLIEAQGLFILPGRLVNQLDRLEDVIVNKQTLPQDLEQFKLVYDEVKSMSDCFDKASVHDAMQAELASVCKRILRNTAVFKEDCHFVKFLNKCGFEEVGYDYKIQAAGRINIIGEHIDYCGGKVLPAAVSLTNTVFVRKNGTDKINLAWTTLPDRISVDIDSIDTAKVSGHAAFQIGCISVFKRSGRKLTGCDMLFDCKVPFGGGLSSSAAIEVSTLSALAEINGYDINKRELALMAQQAERECSGVNCGIMDQYASANGAKDCAMLLDCRSVEHTVIPVKSGEYVFVVANTNKPHNLAESKYNERRAETESGLAVLQKYLDIQTLAQLTLQQYDSYKDKLSENVRKRVKHVVSECVRVNGAVEAIKQGDMKKLGKLLNESHKSLKEDYKVSCRELDVLQSLCVEFDGCIGARMIGGGFGGCVLALVQNEVAESFKKKVGSEYKKIIGYETTFYDTDISDGITIKNLREV